MKKAIKTKWLKALRSGEFDQGVGALCENGKYCCLGVLGAITGNLTISKAGRGRWGHKADCPYTEELEKIGLTPLEANHLMDPNDSGESFKAIAKLIEKTK